jgi:hypothetical protein
VGLGGRGHVGLGGIVTALPTAETEGTGAGVHAGPGVGVGTVADVAVYELGVSSCACAAGRESDDAVFALRGARVFCWRFFVSVLSSATVLQFVELLTAASTVVVAVAAQLALAVRVWVCVWARAFCAVFARVACLMGAAGVEADVSS